MKNSPSWAHVIHKTLNLVISRGCFADDGKEKYKKNIKQGQTDCFCSLNVRVLQYSDCETMKDYKTLCLILWTNYKQLWNSVVGLYFKAISDFTAVTMATCQLLLLCWKAP